jgi:hypothetical protein
MATSAKKKPSKPAAKKKPEPPKAKPAAKKPAVKAPAKPVPPKGHAPAPAKALAKAPASHPAHPPAHPPAKAASAPVKPAAPPAGKPAVAGKPPVPVVAPAPAGKPVIPGKPGEGKPSKKGPRKSLLAHRRGPDGEPFQPGDLLLPGSCQNPDEAAYFFRGSVGSGRPVGLEATLTEVFARRGRPEGESERGDMMIQFDQMSRRFDTGPIEALLPQRTNIRRSFQGVVERAKARRREIGAFLRGLDLGRTENSHLDSHGEASLEHVMLWAARLEKLTDAPEPEQADYNKFHRFLDHIDSQTEALILDIEQTLRRVRDRHRAAHPTT